MLLCEWLYNLYGWRAIALTRKDSSDFYFENAISDISRDRQAEAVAEAEAGSRRFYTYQKIAIPRKAFWSLLPSANYF